MLSVRGRAVRSPVPFGAILFASCTLLAVAPIRRPRGLAVISWIVSAGPNELPYLFLFIVLASNPGIVLDPGRAVRGDWLAVGITAATVVGLVIVARRAFRTREVTEQALRRAFGSARRDPSPTERRLPWVRILLAPWPIRPRAVERVADIPYGPHGRDNLLDLYRQRSRPRDTPTLIYFHGGRFRWGRKSFEARPLLHHLAAHGWTCISANYRRSPTPGEGFPEHLVDVKRVIAWARTYGIEAGVDPTSILVAGSSAGAHLAAMVALTPNDPTFQPGFEETDTSITAGIGLYGYYGSLTAGERLPSDPLAHLDDGAPPFFVLHGDHDTYTPVEGARRFVGALRAASEEPVAYAELPGAQHSFDVFHSVRFEIVVGAIEAFATAALERATTREPRR
jgi:acetyl esterase/lipase